MNREQDDDEYEAYIAHDSVGTSHVIWVLKDSPPRQVKCVGCDD